jgi:branched-chain amino acid transport system permease protein
VSNTLRPLGILLLLILSTAVVGTSFLSEYQLKVVVQMLALAYIAAAWNLMGGFAGLFSLGHIAFVGLGAYTATILQVQQGISPWLGMIAGALLSAALAFIAGFISYRSRLSHAALALLTLVLAQLAYVLSFTLDITQGMRGISIPLRPGLQHMQFESGRGYLYLALAMVAIMYGICILVRHARFGYRLIAIRENERVAEAIGIPAFRYKLMVTTLSAALTAPGGVLIAQYTLFVDPDSAFNVFKSLEIPIYAMVGGLGSAFGPLVGAALMSAVIEFLRPLLSGFGAGLDQVVFGAALMLVVLVAPLGIIGYLQKQGQTTFFSSLRAKKNVVRP